MSEVITKELLEKSVAEHQDFIKMVCRNKYGHDNVKDVLDGVIKYCNIIDEEQVALLKSERFIPAGSILSRCNKGEKGSFSNCYFTPIESDSMDGIFDCQKKLANTFKMRGGSGFDITILRPKATKVDNAAITSSGAVSFLPSFSEIGKVVGVNNRRAAMIATIDIRHPDALDFIKCKAWPEQVFQKDIFSSTLPDIASINISLKISDSFMRAVEDDEDWVFCFPDIEFDKELYNKHWNGDYNKWLAIGGEFKEHSSMNAKVILELIAEASHKCGDPGIMMVDTTQRNTFGTYISDKLKPIGMNPCLTGDMKLLTDCGYKTFESLCDTYPNIVNKDGDITKSHVWCSGEKDTILLSSSDKTELLSCTKDHVVSIIDGTECVAGETKGKRLMPFIQEYYPLERESFIAGFLLGDGCLTDGNNPSKLDMCMNLCEKDINVADFVGIEYTKGKRDYYEREFGEIARKFELCRETKPYIYLPILDDKVDVDSFMCGLFSANGCVITTGNTLRVSYKTSSKLLADGIMSLLKDRYKISPYITTNKEKIVSFYNGDYVCKESYDVNIGKWRDVVRFAESISFIQDYKRANMLDGIIRHSPIVRSIKETGVKKVYDFTESKTHWGVVNGFIVHNCAEEPLSAWNNCLLGAIVMYKYVDKPYTKEAKFNFDMFENDVKIATRVMNIFSDINEDEHPLVEQRNADKFGKRIGLEATGIGDTFAMLGLTYGESDSLDLISSITELMLFTEMKESVYLAKKIGPCLALSQKQDRYDFIEKFKKSGWIELDDDLQSDIVEYGMRNTSFDTFGPTGTLSIISDNCTSGIEPVFKFSFKRKNRIDNQEYAFIHYLACKHMLNNIDHFNGMTLDEARKELKYVEADEIAPVDRIYVQSVIQKYTDASISSTINLKNNATKEDIYNIYINAWRNNLKGITVFRDGCKQGVLSSNDTKKIDEVIGEPTESILIEKQLLPIESAERHKVMWKKSPLYINVSLDDYDPIEIFTKLPKSAGYDSNGVFNNITYLERSGNWDAVCRLISMSLRYGIGLEEVIKQLNQASYSMVDAAGILVRVLNNYTKDKEYEEDEEGNIIGDLCLECGAKAVIKEGGCSRCLECGFSLCG